jgi:hypothetical protein
VRDFDAFALGDFDDWFAGNSRNIAAVELEGDGVACGHVRGSGSLRGAAGGMRGGLMLEYQKSPAPHTACRLAPVFVFGTSNTEDGSQPESGTATARFLVLQHERRRRAALGLRAVPTTSARDIT